MTNNDLTFHAKNARNMLLAGTGLLLLAACGGDDSSPEPEEENREVAMPSDERASAEEPAMPEEAEDSSMDMAAAPSEPADNEGQMAQASDDDGDMAAATSNETAAAGTGTVHEIQMLNADPDNPRERMVFVPDLVVAQPGDTIRFVPTDPSHQSSSIDEMIPDDVEGWRGEINKAVEYTVPEPGVYGYKCVPHYAAGMVGLLIVEGEGMMDNVEEAKSASHVGLAARRFEDIWARAEDQYLDGGS